MEASVSCTMMPDSGGRVNHRLVVMGPSGSGKTTVGQALARKLDAEFVDADDLHPAENVEKQAAGIPLQDEDRWEWLRAVGEALAVSDAMVMACSSLKRVYRDLIRARAPDVYFVELVSDRGTLEERLGQRRGHFMPASLIDSQLRTLEPLDPATETGLRLTADAPIAQLVETAAAVYLESRRPE